jgi:hypothetical protein
MDWATFWAIFSQAHLVTLIEMPNKLGKKILRLLRSAAEERIP